jgi:hypothetical protein
MECGSLLPLCPSPACWRDVNQKRASGRESGSELPHSKLGSFHFSAGGVLICRNSSPPQIRGLDKTLKTASRKDKDNMSPHQPLLKT